MVAAAQALAVDQPEFQGCTAMRTVQFQESHGAVAVAERHQILAEDFYPARQPLQVVGEADGLPEPAHIFTARRTRADMGEFSILLGDIAVKVAAISRLQERGPGRHKKPPVEIASNKRFCLSGARHARGKNSLTRLGEPLRSPPRIR
jgi:hypothetical protein